MLKIYFANEIDINSIGKDVIHDVEAAFNRVKLDNSKKQNRVLELIEQAKYKDQTHIIDRFGDKLSTQFISTGCKAALCVLAFPDKIIDLIECGRNARDIILSVCDNGQVLLSCPEISIGEYSDHICVEIDNKLFNTVDELNNYLKNERLWS